MITGSRLRLGLVLDLGLSLGVIQLQKHKGLPNGLRSDGRHAGEQPALRDGNPVRTDPPLRQRGLQEVSAGDVPEVWVQRAHPNGGRDGDEDRLLQECRNRGVRVPGDAFQVLDG